MAAVGQENHPYDLGKEAVTTKQPCFGRLDSMNIVTEMVSDQMDSMWSFSGMDCSPSSAAGHVS